MTHEEAKAQAEIMIHSVDHTMRLEGQLITRTLEERDLLVQELATKIMQEII